MPLSDARITNFFKPIHSERSAKGKPPPDRTKRARDIQETESNTAKKAKSSLRAGAVNGSSPSSPSGLLSNVPRKQSRHARPDPLADKGSPGAEVIDLTASALSAPGGTRSVEADDGAKARLPERHSPSLTAPTLFTAKHDPFVEGCGSPMPNPFSKRSAMTLHSHARIVNLADTRIARIHDNPHDSPTIGSSLGLSSPTSYFSRQDSLVPSSQSQSIELKFDLVVPPTQTQSAYGTFPQPIRSPMLPPPSLPLSPPQSRRSLFGTTSSAVPSSQTQAICFSESPKRILHTAKHSASDGFPLEVVPSSQSAEEKELAMFMANSQIFPRIVVDSTGSAPTRVGGADEAVGPALDHSAIKGTSPHARQVASPVIEPGVDTFHQPTDTHETTDWKAPQDDMPYDADHSSLDSSPAPHYASSFANTQEDMESGSMIIRNFFNIFDEEGSSLPADFPIPLR